MGILGNQSSRNTLRARSRWNIANHDSIRTYGALIANANIVRDYGIRPDERHRTNAAAASKNTTRADERGVAHYCIAAYVGFCLDQGPVTNIAV